ncbi:MAG TPA: phosphoribosyl-dephospho-CoA transferase [Pseudomonas sp.]|jgi:phosphoribosyl-dephospho-CoA transferase|uniref:malonate decarboxylase holo-ACP synthase n=1 Tax=Stutzerimonas xanthomarina TaxID=271420 RepID=UPI000E9DCC88|nr:malonate decarboxylase holo-ACP synthase [Stutzerimonas xanthomarina]MBU0812421.1 malonate decarboxylase holo-ACP synthase [Gammaproteobacteria bacterium]HAQ87871.1 phosphoribosyl-dephospho-CoA transferase [Pseudomonas sp.]MBK3849585.1 malonate decarboxylase holo-ACP synthase [Stutzerimonas xanthomarina]MBU0853404.1 malonate decarboxylase holo-ACP synthase [Gammaproteobacteria bacterium]MBU2282469.1 malonate decarboxylase holo-ACP synthase [Gammaproteobacteria bacterium]|tara:strand:+ start:964 stop:1584 length:621 start_codon:yes stop_codon:yes gene_type:complete
MHDTPRPHDLLWGMTPAQLQADAPAWAHEVLIAGQPVVVRRAMVENGQLAVGLRGSSRDQRYASVMPARSVLRKVRPEQLVERLPVSDLPALHALKQLKPNMDALGLCWGVTGSVGFQLATGLPTAHTDSDLDLLLRTPIELPRHKARTLLGLLDEAACRVDLQLETPSGAIAMREWAGSASRVLLKCVTGARLVENPWDQAEMVA